MHEEALQQIISAAQSDGLHTSRHYEMRLFEREMPELDHVKYLLCDDSPMVIEEEFHKWSNVYLVWGIMDSGRVGHICISEPPFINILTAYWPDLEPDEWQDKDYIERVQS